MPKNVRDTNKYFFKVGNAIVHPGVTDDLYRREREHLASGRYTVVNGSRLYWRDGHIDKVGKTTTRDAALDWEREQHDKRGTT